MCRLLVSIVMILFISGQAVSDDYEHSFELIPELFEWGMKIYEIINRQSNLAKSQKNIEMIMRQVAEVSSKLDTFENKMNVKLDPMLNTLLVDIELENRLNQLNEKLRHYFTKIDYYYDESKNYRLGGQFSNQTLIEFSHKVLWGRGSVPNYLDEMHEIFIPDGTVESGFLEVMLQRTMLYLLDDCNTDISPQQKVYYIYIQLIITEIKGLMTQQQSLMIQRWFDVTGELNIAKSNFQTRLREYHALFTRETPRFPQHLRRCEANPSERGVNFFELQKFSRIAILDADIVINHGCVACPMEYALNAHPLLANTTINKCRRMGTSVTACPAEPDSPHEYLWLRENGEKHYGPNTQCANNKTIKGGYVRIPATTSTFATMYSCSVCACTMETNDIPPQDKSAIWRISVTEQMSDFLNNKVVTGVRFVTWDNALHLQINEAQFTHSGMIYNNSGWKDLDIGVSLDGFGEVRTPMFYVPLRHDRKTLYLDDIKVPETFVVTGVRLKLVDDTAFMLQIMATEFELATGNLYPLGTWIDASTFPMRTNDYKRKRVEINMGESNDPTRATGFKYNVESNKLIRFTHTDINKDAGQTTIPLIDSQSVEAQPAFPLSGIGLSFKGRDGFGGYIAPHIYTLNVKNYLKHVNIPRSNPPITTEMPLISARLPSYKSFVPEKAGSENDACC